MKQAIQKQNCIQEQIDSYVKNIWIVQRLPLNIYLIVKYMCGK
ncbi:MAG: hypothetical protein ACLUD1_03715 [Clostridia bacterium]